MKRPASLYFILATLLIDAIGIGIVFPILPDLMIRVGAADVGQGAVLGGILMAAYAGAQFLCAPAVGSLSDALGRKPVLLAALALLAVDYVIMALAGTFVWLLIGRTLAGMAGATYITATAYIADISDPKDRAANFGLIGAAFGIGFVLGPAIGGLAATLHVTAPFWLAAAFSAANLVFGLFVLPESLPPERRRRFGRRDINPFGAIIAAFRVPGLAVPLVCIFVFEFANMVYPALWAFWTEEVFGWEALLRGLSLAAYGVMVAFTQAVVMPRAIRTFGEQGTLMVALGVALIGAVGFGFTGSVTGLAVFLILSSLSDMAPPTLTAMAANRVGEDRQGLVQGVIASLASVAAVVAPLLLTALFQLSVSDRSPVYLPGAPFLFSAVLIAAIVPVAWRMGRRG